MSGLTFIFYVEHFINSITAYVPNVFRLLFLTQYEIMQLFVKAFNLSSNPKRLQLLFINRNSSETATESLTFQRQGNRTTIRCTNFCKQALYALAKYAYDFN